MAENQGVTSAEVSPFAASWLKYGHLAAALVICFPLWLATHPANLVIAAWATFTQGIVLLFLCLAAAVRICVSVAVMCRDESRGSLVGSILNALVPSNGLFCRMAKNVDFAGVVCFRIRTLPVLSRSSWVSGASLRAGAHTAIDHIASPASLVVGQSPWTGVARRVVVTSLIIALMVCHFQISTVTFGQFWLGDSTYLQSLRQYELLPLNISAFAFVSAVLLYVHFELSATSTLGVSILPDRLLIDRLTGCFEFPLIQSELLCLSDLRTDGNIRFLLILSGRSHGAVLVARRGFDGVRISTILDSFTRSERGTEIMPLSSPSPRCDVRY